MTSRQLERAVAPLGLFNGTRPRVATDAVLRELGDHVSAGSVEPSLSRFTSDARTEGSSAFSPSQHRLPIARRHAYAPAGSVFVVRGAIYRPSEVTLRGPFGRGSVNSTPISEQTPLDVCRISSR